ncbi:MAG: hypothetical protein ABI210_03790 [Abditibacteriaceae bacterium]
MWSLTLELSGGVAVRLDDLLGAIDLSIAVLTSVVEGNMKNIKLPKEMVACWTH